MASDAHSAQTMTCVQFATTQGEASTFTHLWYASLCRYSLSIRYCKGTQPEKQVLQDTLLKYQQYTFTRHCKEHSQHASIAGNTSA